MTQEPSPLTILPITTVLHSSRSDYLAHNIQTYEPYTALISFPEAAVFFLFLFHCRNLHLHLYTYYSFPRVP